MIISHSALLCLFISNKIKDNFNVPGKPSSVGFTNWALEPMKEESTIVGVLRHLGAVQYVKTNVPTAMMIAESVNNTYGR
jgi:amidase